MDNDVKSQVERYFLQSSNPLDELFDHKNQGVRHLNNLSYYEISLIASYNNHEDIKNFRRLNKACNIGACQSILSNLQLFDNIILEQRKIRAEQFINLHFPKNFKEITDPIDYEFDKEKLSSIKAKFNQNATIKEVLHIVMRLMNPSFVKQKFDIRDHQSYYLKESAEETILKLQSVNYSQISSQVYKEILKRKRMWNIGTDQILKFQDINMEQFVKFIDHTLAFLSIREDQELFKNMNEYHVIKLQYQYHEILNPKVKFFKANIALIKNMNGGRINSLLPMKSKPFQKIGASIVSVMIEYFDTQSQFSLFRVINRKFNQCFEQHITNKVVSSQNLISQYDQNMVQHVKDDILSNLTPILQSLKKLSESFNNNEDYLRNSEFTCQNLILNCLYILDNQLKDQYQIMKSENGVTLYAKAEKMKQLKIDDISIQRIKQMRQFIIKYGPRDKQYREYLLLKNIKNDQRFDFIKLLLDYAFLHRPALKIKSSLHKELLEKQENMVEIELLRKYFKHNKPQVQLPKCKEDLVIKIN